VGSEVTKTVQLASTGTASVTISGMTFSGSGISVTGLAVPLTLAAGKDASLTITYKPSSAGTLAGSVSITSNASDPSELVGLSGTATTAATSALTATPSSIAFGNVVVGTETTQTIRLANSGTANVTVSGLAPSVAAVSVSGLTVPMTLAPGKSANFTAAFKPTAASSVSGKITVTSNATDSSMPIDLTGTGQAAIQKLTANPASVSFGNATVGSSSARQVTVTNTGNVSTTISSAAIAGTGFSLSGSGSSVALNPGQSETYTVNFDPKSAGSDTGTLSIASNAPGSPMKVSLAGTASATPPTNHSVALTWDRSSSTVVGYFVYRSSKPSGPYAKVNSSADASTSFSDSTVANGQVYYYVVTAVDSSNIESAYSNQVSVTIPTN
jgi:Abnormal spindle-like microcephaly-assoc'd, ASPM-SPD-2-Hydin